MKNILKEKTNNFSQIIIKIADSVKKAREKRGYSQMQLSAIIGCKPYLISRLECYDLTPSLNFLIKIADALEMEFSEPKFYDIDNFSE